MASWLEKLGLQRTRPQKEGLKDFCLELCPDNRIASFMITDHTPRSGNPFIRFVKEAARKAVLEEARGIPDNLLLFYAGIRKEELPPVSGLQEKEPRQAWRFIIENGGITDGNSVPLRRAAYLEAHGVETDRRNLEGLEHSPGYKDFVAYETARERILQGRSARFLVTAVKTDQGVRVFNRGLHGPRHLHEYLQEIADNFYSPCGKGPGTLSIFRIETSSKRLMEMSRQPGRSFPASQPGLEVFGSYRPVASFDLSPTAANLDRFVTAGSLELSRRNLDIMTLQDIAEKGYAHLALEEPFRYRREFASVEKRTRKAIQGKGAPSGLSPRGEDGGAPGDFQEDRRRPVGKGGSPDRNATVGNKVCRQDITHAGESGGYPGGGRYRQKEKTTLFQTETCRRKTSKTVNCKHIWQPTNHLPRKRPSTWAAALSADGH